MHKLTTYKDFQLIRYKIQIFLGSRFPNIFSDKFFLEGRYYVELRNKLNLKRPVTFCEKLQWLKLYNRRPEYTIMVDKVKVKEYVANKIGSEYIIPTLGVWDNPDEIDFDSLPNQFVLKCNHNSNIGMCICKNKNELDKEKVKDNLRKGLRQNYFLCGREWPYKDVQRKILAEKFMQDNDENTDLRDYKFFCFNGEPRLCQVISDRTTNETIDFYDMRWNRLIGLTGLYSRNKIYNSKKNINCPSSFTKMKEIAKSLSKGLPFSRIDLYEINDKPYFGEITFFPACGFGKFMPNEWNEKVGSWIELPIKSNRNHSVEKRDTNKCL